MKRLILKVTEGLGYEVHRKQPPPPPRDYGTDGSLLTPSHFFALLDDIAHYEDKMTVAAVYEYESATDCYVLPPGVDRSQIDAIFDKYGIDLAADRFPLDGKLGAPIETTLRKIHYGCGPNVYEGWLNVDVYAQNPVYGSKNEYCRVNLTRRHPFRDGAFDFGYAEDFLEHLGQVDSITFLAEAFRTLAPGGVLRLSFPGLEGVLQEHYPDVAITTLHRAKLESAAYWDHLHFYSRDELALVASKIGFTDVTFTDYGQSSHRELADLEYRDQQQGLNTYVELTK